MRRHSTLDLIVLFVIVIFTATCYYFNEMKERKVIKMLKYIKCTNGSLYLIQSPLIPSVIENY